MRIVVKIDQKLALLSGRELGSTAEIDVTMESAGVDWPEIVGSLDMSQTPPASCLPGCDDATTQAFIGAVRTRREAAEAEAAKKAAEITAQLDRYESSLDAREDELAGPMQECIYRYAPDTHGQYYQPSNPQPGTICFRGVTRRLSCAEQPGALFRYDDLNERHGTLRKREREQDERNEAEIKSANEVIFARELPRLEAELIARNEAEAAEAAEKAAAEKAVRLAKFATRLESGLYERETDSYNERRYGRPWIAAVSLSGGKLAYDFEAGTVTASFGSSGMLSITCRPGDVIAWGQKDLRRPDKSEHHILQMRDDGGMNEIDRTGAVKYLRSLASK